MTNPRTTSDRPDAHLHAWMDAEAEAPASTRLFEQVLATTRTMPQVRRWPTWWPISPDRGRAPGGVSVRQLLLLVAIGLALLGAAVIAGGGRPLFSRIRPGPTTEARLATLFAQTCAHPLSIAVAGGDVWVSCFDQVRWFDGHGALQGAESGSALGVDAD